MPVTNSKYIRNLRERLKLNGRQKEILIGTLLGDGSLIKNSWKKHYRLDIEHCKRQKKLVFWKYDVFKEWTLSSPKYRTKTKSIMEIQNH